MSRPGNVSAARLLATLARRTLAPALALLSAGCAVLGVPAVDPAPDSPPAQRSVTVQEESVPAPTELDPELVFDYLLADIAERRGDPKTSLEAATRVAERTGDPALILRAFRAALRGGDAAVALDMAALLDRAGFDAIRVGFARVQAFLVDDRVDDAQREIFNLLSDPPEGDRKTVFNHAGEVFAQQREPAPYVAIMRELADAYPGDPHGYFAVAYVASRAQELDALGAAISRALELDPDWEQAAVVKFAYLVQVRDRRAASDFAEDFVARNPKALDLAQRLAQLLAAQGDFEAAHRYFERILRHQPENSEILMTTALVRMQMEKWASARRLLLRHLRLNPDSDETRMRLARVASERHRFDEAANWYGSVTDENLVFEAQLQVAEVLNDSSGGEAALDHLAGLTPASREEEVEIVLARERVLRSMSRIEDAFQLLDAAVQEIPDDGDLLYSRALLAAELGELERHEQDIRQVIAIDPDNAHAYNALGYTLADQTKRYDEALELISRALELAPEDPFILDSMGWVQYRLGRYDDAEEYLRRALAIRDDAEIAAHLGEVLWVKGGRAEAEKLWQRALTADPENRTLLDTLKRLQPR
ncbi:MAG: tetratricopeptide repeat protein [Proteobacteria bacterium]|nr:MAG: tetratricopeptide repeat protein [Pseudomonadota bacterium]